MHGVGRLMHVAAASFFCLSWPGVAPSDTDADGDTTSAQGDAEYGEYLSGTCLTCHRADGVTEGIPRITGWTEQQFVGALQDYKAGIREHDAMQLIAGRLNDEEIAALAAYFAGLD